MLTSSRTREHDQTQRPKTSALSAAICIYLKEAKGRDEASLDAVAKRDRSLRGVRPSTATSRNFISNRRGHSRPSDGDAQRANRRALSASTVHSTLAALKAFFAWLAHQPGYRSRIKYRGRRIFQRARQSLADRHRAPITRSARRSSKSARCSTPCRRRRKSNGAIGRSSPSRSFRARATGRSSPFKLKHIDIET